MSLEELNEKLKQQNLIGYWTIPNTRARKSNEIA